MRSMRAQAVLRGALCAVLIWCGCAVFGAGHGDWWMFQHDALHSGRSTVAGPQAPSPKWQFQTPFAAGNVRSPVFGADGTIYCQSDDGNLYAINPSGTLKWSASVGSPQFDLPPAPAVDASGTIYVLGNLAPGSGSTAPKCYCYTFDASGTRKSAIRLGYNFLIITSTSTQATWIDAGRSTSSPVIGGTGTVYLGTQGGIYTVTPNGSASTATATAFNYDVSKGKIYAVPGSQQQLVSMVGTNSSPALGADGTLYAGPISNSGEVCAVTPNLTRPDQSVKWTYPATPNGAADYWSSPAVGADGTIVASGNGGITWDQQTRSSLMQPCRAFHTARFRLRIARKLRTMYGQ